MFRSPGPQTVKTIPTRPLWRTPYSFSMLCFNAHRSLGHQTLSVSLRNRNLKSQEACWSSTELPWSGPSQGFRHPRRQRMCILLHILGFRVEVLMGSPLSVLLVDALSAQIKPVLLSFGLKGLVHGPIVGRGNKSREPCVLNPDISKHGRLLKFQRLPSWLVETTKRTFQYLGTSMG